MLFIDAGCTSFSIARTFTYPSVTITISLDFKVFSEPLAITRFASGSFA